LRWSAEERARLTLLRSRLDRLDQLIQTLAGGEETAQGRKEHEDLLTQRRQTADELETFRQELEKRHGVLAGQILDLATVQKALPADAAFLSWIDLPAPPNAKDPSGERWAVLLCSTGDPLWIHLRGSGPGDTWTEEDTYLPPRLRKA